MSLRHAAPTGAAWCLAMTQMGATAAMLGLAEKHRPAAAPPHRRNTPAYPTAFTPPPLHNDGQSLTRSPARSQTRRALPTPGLARSAALEAPPLSENHAISRTTSARPGLFEVGNYW